MHAILGIITSILVILFYLSMIQRNGMNFRWIGWLNPFSWQRRRAWRKANQVDPVYALKSPMEATACLMYAMARTSGDVTREQKTAMTDIFKNEFHMPEREAAEMLSACSFLVVSDHHVTQNLQKFFAPNIEKFSAEQKQSAIDLTERVGLAEGAMTPQQQDFLAQLREFLFPPPEKAKKWS